jgi:predicted transcriptional regulator of viral defense system
LIKQPSNASKYQIAYVINDGAYLSHHSAFEYMGITNQIFHVIFVSSDKYFNDFEFEGIVYKYIPSKKIISEYIRQEIRKVYVLLLLNAL